MPLTSTPRTSLRLVAAGLPLVLAAAMPSDAARPGATAHADGSRAGVAASPAQERDGIPAWFLRDIEVKTRGEGIWVADNAAYRDEDGGIDAFVMQWTEGLGGASITGRLYAVREGRELPTVWEFRGFWHPVKRVAMVYQFGRDGTVAWGARTPPDAEGNASLEQTMARPDRTTSRIRHETHSTEEREVGRSFDRVGEAWQPWRTYTWVYRR